MSEERAASQDTAGRDPAPPGSGEAVRPGPARLPRGWRTYLVVCALAMVAGAAGTTAVRMLAGPAGGAASAIPSPPAANTAFVADDNGTGADNQANILRYTVRGLVHVLAGRGAGAGRHRPHAVRDRAHQWPGPAPGHPAGGPYRAVRPHVHRTDHRH